MKLQLLLIIIQKTDYFLTDLIDSILSIVLPRMVYILDAQSLTSSSVASSSSLSLSSSSPLYSTNTEQL